MSAKTQCPHCGSTRLEEYRRHAEDQIRFAWSQAHKWEGKCAILRHENNKLRRENERLRDYVDKLELEISARELRVELPVLKEKQP
jgi:predicted RNase H-like nuclease (RuvC/YqgF family)